MRNIDVVMVTYNSIDVLKSVAASLRESRDRIASLAIIDNGSSDGTVELVANLDWGVVPTLEQRPDNPGFGASMNFGAALGEAEYLLLLNPDVVIDRGAVLALLGDLTSATNLAAVGARLETADRRPVSSARYFPSRLDLVRRRAIEVNLADGLTSVDWICGAVMLWRRNVYLSLGGFDERYFLYYEDVDICKRARDAGWSVAADGRVRVIHDQGHGRQTSPYLRRVSRQSRRKYARRWLGIGGWFSAVGAETIEAVGRILRGGER